MMKQFPLNANGKVDRKQLPIPTIADSVGGSSGSSSSDGSGTRVVVAPRTPIEEKLLPLWKSILKSDDVSVHDDIFARGATSLSAMVLLTRIRSILPTLRAFAPVSASSSSSS